MLSTATPSIATPTSDHLLPRWGAPLGWSLALLPSCPLVLGAVVHLVWGGRGVARLVHAKSSLQPTRSGPPISTPVP